MKKIIATILILLILAGISTDLCTAQERANAGFQHSGVEDVVFQQKAEKPTGKSNNVQECKPEIENFDFPSGTRECKSFDQDYFPEWFSRNMECACQVLPINEKGTNCVIEVFKQKLGAMSNDFVSVLKSQKKERNRMQDDIRSPDRDAEQRGRTYTTFVWKNFAPLVYRLYHESFEKCCCDLSTLPALKDWSKVSTYQIGEEGMSAGQCPKPETVFKAIGKCNLIKNQK